MNKIIFILLILLNIRCNSPAKINFAANQKPSVLQGITTENTSQITIVRNKKQNFNYTITPSSKLKVSSKSFPNSPWLVDHLFIGNLKLNTTYQLTIKNGKGLTIDTRNFKSFNTNQIEQKISIASCMDDRFSDIQKGMWDGFTSQKSDLHFFIGDNVYGDKGVSQPGMAKPHELWQRYVDTRLSLEVYKANDLTPTLATWDDHDYGNNGGGINYPYKKESKQIFNSFFAQSPIMSTSYNKGPGISFMFKSGKQNYYFLDNRSFRTNSKAKVDYHLGELQEKWLFSQLKKNPEFSWLINGNQFFGGYQKFESFEGTHPNNFKKFISKLKNIKNKVGFISGDRHLFEVMEIKKPDLNYSTLELTTSSIHAKVYPSAWGKYPNPRQLYGAAKTQNFATLKTRSIPKGIDIELKGFGPKNKVLYLLNKVIK